MIYNKSYHLPSNTTDPLLIKTEFVSYEVFIFSVQ